MVLLFAEIYSRQKFEKECFNETKSRGNGGGGNSKAKGRQPPLTSLPPPAVTFSCSFHIGC